MADQAPPQPQAPAAPAPAFAELLPMLERILAASEAASQAGAASKEAAEAARAHAEHAADRAGEQGPTPATPADLKDMVATILGALPSAVAQRPAVLAPADLEGALVAVLGRPDLSRRLAALGQAAANPVSRKQLAHVLSGLAVAAAGFGLSLLGKHVDMGTLEVSLDRTIEAALALAGGGWTVWRLFYPAKP